MPFEVATVMEQRLKLVTAYGEGDVSMAELCRKHGVSRKTGYIWVRRYREGGVRALVDRSHAAHQHPNQVERWVSEAVVQLRKKHGDGPKKLRVLFAEKYGDAVTPAPSTIAAILRREGLVIPKVRRRTRSDPYMSKLASADRPNRVWAIDFKGWFLTGDGQRCNPLTITDVYSRMLLAAVHLEK
jgi:putative transposase